MLTPDQSGNRILFLNLFTQELIANSRPKAEVQAIKEPEIKEEKIEEEKKKEEEYLISPKIVPSAVFPGISKERIEKKAAEQIEAKKIIEVKKPQPIAPVRQAPQGPQVQLSKPAYQPMPVQQTRPLQSAQIKKKFTSPISAGHAEMMFTTQSPSPPAAERGFDLGKLNMVLLDRETTMVECPGPNKFVLIKKAGKINLTRISLAQNEIDKIIENFSKAARIPIIGGMFKAIIGNLTIHAVVSGIVGSRFIIYKSTPYSIIEE